MPIRVTHAGSPGLNDADAPMELSPDELVIPLEEEGVFQAAGFFFGDTFLIRSRPLEAMGSGNVAKVLLPAVALGILLTLFACLAFYQEMRYRGRLEKEVQGTNAGSRRHPQVAGTDEPGRQSRGMGV